MQLVHVARPILAGLLSALLAAPLAQAQSSQVQDYPARTVTLVVPYPAGGGLDALARQLGQAGGPARQAGGDREPHRRRHRDRRRVGRQGGARRLHLMLGTSTPFAITVTLNKSLPYDPAKDFAPIALVSNAPFMLLVHPSRPVHSVGDLIKLAKEKPGQLSYGSAGPGSPQHLSFELLKTMTGIDLVHVPHRGDAPAH